jgi:hypothetical protein
MVHASIEEDVHYADANTRPSVKAFSFAALVYIRATQRHSVGDVISPAPLRPGQREPP